MPSTEPPEHSWTGARAKLLVRREGQTEKDFFVDLSTPLVDLDPSTESVLEDVKEGLERNQKTLPSKYLYDKRGSQLFDQICELDEYYLTRTELQIMRDSAADIATEIGPAAVLIELGSGSSIKTRILLDHLELPKVYVPVDISQAHLTHSTKELARAYPHIPIRPVCADFTEVFQLPAMAKRSGRRVVYLPGSTIGNFNNEFVLQILEQVANMCGTAGGLLIGIDLQKDVEIILDAYNDAAGVTAEFNLNMLRHINRELDSDFDLDSFEHSAIYNREQHRIEMHLVSQGDQVVNAGDHEFEFEDGETICTEYSHKYTIDDFAALAAQAGLELGTSWTDPSDAFAVLYFDVMK